MILDDIKQFLVEKNLVDEEIIKYDYDSANGCEVVLLELYDSIPCDVARRSGVQIYFKFFDLSKCRETAFAVHDLFFPIDHFQKSLFVNEKVMHVKLNRGPCYKGKDASKRHNYILDITLTYNR